MFKMSTVFVPQRFWDSWFLMSNFVLHLEFSWGKGFLRIWNTEVLMSMIHNRHSHTFLTTLLADVFATNSESTELLFGVYGCTPILYLKIHLLHTPRKSLLKMSSPFRNEQMHGS